MYAADTLASQALCRTSARRSYTKNEPGGVFSSPTLKKFWLRVNSFRKLKFFSHRKFHPDLIVYCDSVVSYGPKL